ncbi:hypothetical protein [Legionella cincinnatiensis]|uniref:Uncharacterized protein n=1 Tax=Legionella cincinnatiensis TaxID=28085 RepID=A0A378IL32_9GAMM|nr:hypothetical protein [Legionella cincinnatiensis]KTC88533.1 hypothetical protein Lcin_1410 [Legionella cincinnatiensis]STX35978.1 Uncharacterised protein [Legionella cincinnatiensis]
MLRFIGFFAQPTKIAIQSGTAAMATAAIASGVYQVGTTVHSKVKEKYEQLQYDSSQLNDCYSPKINYTSS